MSEFDSYFARYSERYMVSDLGAVAAMYDVPVLAVREGRAISLGDEAELRHHLATLMDAYSKAGAARAEIADLHVDPLGGHAANATVRWRVVDAEGTLLRDFHTTYYLLRTEGTWRIRAYTNHDA